MTTARTLIGGALRSIGVLAEGEAPSADQASAALETLNGLLASMDLFGITIYREEIAAKAAVTVAEDVIVRADTAAGSFSVTLPKRPRDTARVAFFDVSGTFGTFPLTVARNGALIIGNALDLVLNVANTTVDLSYRANANSWELLQQPGPDALNGAITIDDALAIPRTHEWGVRNMLAEALAAEYDRPIPPQVARDARASRDMFLAKSRRDLPPTETDVALRTMGQTLRRRTFL